MRKCAICGNEFDKFLSIEQKYIDLPKQYGRTKNVRSEFCNLYEYSCPCCYFSDRDRMIVLFLKLLHLKLNQGIDIFEVAPSGAIQKFLYEAWSKCNLYTADLYMEGVDYNVDIQNMSLIPDERFDFLVCSHVLEHVQDDRKAMNELYRILDKKGLGIILVPMDLNQDYTDEQWGLSAEENWRRFGQDDHCRAYNKDDFISRLKQAGFGVYVLGKDFFGEEAFEQNAFTDTSCIYLVYKNKELYNNVDNIIETYAEVHKNNDFIKSYNVVDEKCNYWIDLCDADAENFKAWGWAYINNVDSRMTKFRLLFEGKKNQYIFGKTIRKREDIHEKFGNCTHNYSYSGIDAIIPIMELKHDKYDVFLLLQNEDKRYKILMRKDLLI